jgi:hypothetical protein
MKMEARLSRTYPTKEQAGALRAALEPDDEGYVEAATTGPTLTLHVRARNVGELRRSLEDVLACLSGAERTWESRRGSRGAREESPK